MKNRKWKTVIAVLAVFAAGVCYILSAGAGRAGGLAELTKIPEESVLSREDGAGGGGGTAGDAAVPKKEEAAVRGAGEQPADEGLGRDASGRGKGGEAEALSAESKSPETEALLWVHVCGEVRSPGVYSLAAGSRVYQAVELAGGFTDEADPDYLNMAQPLSDGMRLEILDRETAKLLEAEDPGRAMQPVQTAVAQREAGGSEGPDSRGKVNINTAPADELMTLTGIGKARAADIIAYREEHGPFRNIEDIMKVSGIKEAAFEKIKEDITV